MHLRLKLPPLPVILLLAFVVRVLGCALARFGWVRNDGPEYLRMAEAILAGHPYSYFPNGYPLLLAALEYVSSPELVPLAAVAVNVVLSTAVVGMTYLLAWRLMGNKTAAQAAALLTAVYPEQINYTSQLMSETPTVFLLVLGILCTVSERPLAGGWWLSLCSGFRATFSPVGAALLLVSVIFRRPRREMARLALGLLLGWLVFFGLQKAGVIAASSNLNTNLLIAVKCDSEHLDWRYNYAPQSELDGAPKTYLDFVRAHPLAYARQRGLAMWEMWGPLPSAQQPSPFQRDLLTRLLIGVRFPVLMLALWGGWRRRQEFATWVLLAPILLVTAVHFLTFATPRFTLPLEPLVIVLAVSALVDLRRRAAPPVAPESRGTPALQD